MVFWDTIEERKQWFNDMHRHYRESVTEALNYHDDGLPFDERTIAFKKMKASRRCWLLMCADLTQEQYDYYYELLDRFVIQ